MLARRWLWMTWSRWFTAYVQSHRLSDATLSFRLNWSARISNSSKHRLRFRSIDCMPRKSGSFAKHPGSPGTAGVNGNPLASKTTKSWFESKAVRIDIRRQRLLFHKEIDERLL